MKAISVKYLSPTDHKGARLKATDGDGNSITISYPHEFSPPKCQSQAAVALCRKMGWTGKLQAGCIGNLWVFVFVDGLGDQFTI